MVMWLQADRLDSGVARTPQPGGVAAVRDHDGNGGIELSRADRVDDRLKIRTPSRNQHAEETHLTSYHRGCGGRGGSILKSNRIFPPVLSVLRGGIVISQTHSYVASLAVRDATIARYDLADADRARLAGLTERVEHALCLARLADDDESDAHVEGPV